MKILFSDQILNNISYRELPNGTIKDLVIRWSGTNQAAVAVTLAQLGLVRVNTRGTDIVNESVGFFSLFDNAKYGVAEFSSVVGGAFAATILIPFHAPWDDLVGLFNDDSFAGYVELRNTVTVATIVSGTVAVSYVEGNAIASYLTYFLQQNLQVGGASQATQTFTGIDISSLFIEANVNLTNVFVQKDSVNRISSDQATLLAYSNLINRIETAITMLEVDLNPYRYIPAGGKETVLVATLTAATTVIIHTMGFARTPDAAAKSTYYYNTKPEAAPVSVSMPPVSGERT